MNTNQIREIIENHFGSRIVSSHVTSGGCISDSSIICMNSGEKYFLKINRHNPGDMFLKEANGLIEIAKTNSIRVPHVMLVGDDFILLECVEGKSRREDFFEEFGIKFAQMHKFENNAYGFFEDNYIGSTIQHNIPAESEKTEWTKFYFNKRLLFQIKLAERNGYVDSTFRKYFNLLEAKIEAIIDSGDEKPCLLHGDLWGGNFISDENGKACVIDPAVYYGNREADLAMTKLFGGFQKEFYLSYNETYPLKAGYEYRENIYKLYHVLNHLNLFGKGYYSQALSLIKYYL